MHYATMTWVTTECVSYSVSWLYFYFFPLALFLSEVQYLTFSQLNFSYLCRSVYRTFFLGGGEECLSLFPTNVKA